VRAHGVSEETRGGVADPERFWGAGEVAAGSRLGDGSGHGPVDARRSRGRPELAGSSFGGVTSEWSIASRLGEGVRRAARAPAAETRLHRGCGAKRAGVRAAAASPVLLVGAEFAAAAACGALSCVIGSPQRLA